MLALATATLARWLLAPVLPDTVPFITFFPAVAVAAWYGGLWAGVAAALAGYLIADWLFIPPRFTLSLFDPQAGAAAQSVVFIAMSGMLIWLIEALRRTSTRAFDAARVAVRERKTVEVTLSSIGDGVIATDKSGRITFMNPVAEALTGWSNDAARHQPLPAVFRIVNELTREAVEDPCAKVLRTGRCVGLANHTVLIAREGGERPIDDSAAPIIDESGAVLGVVLVFRDATRERQAQEALQRLAAIVVDSQDAIIGKTIAGVITNWNPAAGRLYGFTAEEAIGQPISIIVPPDRRDELTHIMQRLARGEHIPAWDTVRMRKDGTLVDVSLQISPIRNSYGEVVGASKVARDITTRKRNEAVLSFLATTSANLAALTDRSSALQQAASAMVPFFADWCVVFRVNDQGGIEHQACAHRDADGHALLSQYLEAYPLDWDMPAPTVEALRSGQTQFVADVPPAIIERIARTPEHLELLRALHPQSVISVPLRVRDRIFGAITFVEASGSRRYEAHDVSLAEDLGRRVATAIDNAHLFNSLKAADRQKDEFLAMLAHELRNPLAAIHYAAEVARLGDGNLESELVEIIRRQVQHLTRMIDDLLDLSRISRNKIRLQKVAADAGTVARRAAETVRPLIDERQHRLVLQVADQPLPIHGDVTRLEQVVGNLLTNAAKYTPEGGEITLSADAEDGVVVIRVRDTGIGIAPHVLPQVFELFSQAETALDRSKGGLGIGLTVARKLIELHGGTIAAHSAGIGQGAEFAIRLPRSANMHPDDPRAAPAVKATSHRLRIVIVEDNRDNARTAAMLLGAMGHEVDIAYDGLNGLEMAQVRNPDVMLVDIGLPGLNGYEVASRIRQHAGSRPALIAVSGYGQPKDQERARAAGFDHHLTKPVTSEALSEILAGITPRVRPAST